MSVKLAFDELGVIFSVKDGCTQRMHSSRDMVVSKEELCQIRRPISSADICQTHYFS